MVVLATYGDNLYDVVLVAHIFCAIVGFGAVYLNALYGKEVQKRPGPEGIAVFDANHRVSKVGEQQIRLEWNGSATKNYKILGTRNLFGPADFSNWQTVAQDIPGTNGPVSATFDVSRAVQYAFLRVMPVP